MKLSRKQWVVLVAIALLLLAVTAIFLHRTLAVGFDEYIFQPEIATETTETEIPVQTELMTEENLYDFEQNGLEPLVEELQKRNPQFNLNDYEILWNGSIGFLSLNYRTNYFSTDEGYTVSIKNNTVVKITERLGKNGLAAAPESERNRRIFFLNCKIYLFELLYDRERMIWHEIESKGGNWISNNGYSYVYITESDQMMLECGLLLHNPDHTHALENVQKYF